MPRATRWDAQILRPRRCLSPHSTISLRGFLCGRGLRYLTDELAAIVAQTGQAAAFEALYEVFGFDKTNFGGELVYSRKLDTKVIWETRLINQ